MGASAAKKKWIRGKNCGHWLGRGGHAPLVPQVQVILTNAHENLQRMPAEVRAILRKHVQPMGCVRNKTFGSRILSGLCAISASTIENTVLHVNASKPSKRPVKRKAADEATSMSAPPVVSTPTAASPDGASQAEPTAQDGGDAPKIVPQCFVNLNRACAFLSSSGIAKSKLPHLVHVIVEARGDVGNSYHQDKFVTAFDK